MNNIPHKIQKNINNIEMLKKQLSQWEKLSKDDLLQSVSEFEKTLRMEVSVYYNDLFNDAKFAETLLNIYKREVDNSKIVVLLISALGYMIQRYQLPETQTLYEFMVENAYKKSIGPTVALFLPRLKHFKDYSGKWKYFIAVKDMSPKKIAENAFEIILEVYGSEIPEETKAAVVHYFNKKAEGSNNEYGKRHYLDLANKFK